MKGEEKEGFLSRKTINYEMNKMHTALWKRGKESCAPSDGHIRFYERQGEAAEDGRREEGCIFRGWILRKASFD